MKGKALKDYRETMTEQEMLRRLPPEEQQEYFDICAGLRYPSLMSDIIAKNCFDPDVHPDRLEFLLRHVTGDMTIKVEGSFKNEGGAGFTDAKQIVFDIPVRLSDGRLSDVDFQVQAQDFALERGQIYGSDLLTIQYSKTSTQKKGDVNYDSVKEIILVFLLRNSPKGFRDFCSERYVHRFDDYAADSGFSYKPLIKTVYVQVDKALEQFENGIDGEHDPELQLLLAMMGDLNDELVQERIRESSFMSEIAVHVRKLSLNREVQKALLAEKYYDLDLAAVKHYERREGREEGEYRGRLEMAVRFVKSGSVSKEKAAELAEISPEELEEALRAEGE